MKLKNNTIVMENHSSGLNFPYEPAQKMRYYKGPELMRNSHKDKACSSPDHGSGIEHYSFLL